MPVLPGDRCGRAFQPVPVGVPHGHVRRVRVSQLLHLRNGFLAAAAQLADVNLRTLVLVDAHAFGGQLHVPGQGLDIGLLPLGLGAFAAFLVYHRKAQGIEHLLLRPGVLGIIDLVLHGQEGGVLIQIFLGAGVVGHVAVLVHRFGEHVRQLAFAPVVDEMAVLFSGFALVITLLPGIALVGGVVPQVLGYRIIFRPVFLGEHRRIS